MTVGVRRSAREPLTCPGEIPTSGYKIGHLGTPGQEMYIHLPDIDWQKLAISQFTLDLAST